jgi:hypothetical protein
MSVGLVSDFRPSANGFPFPNAWPPGPTLRLGPVRTPILGFGDASAGLCGGMVLTVRDLFDAGIAMPPEPRPTNGSPRFNAIVRRQVESLDWLRVPLRLFDLQAFRPDPPTALATLLRREPPRVVAVRDEWPGIRAEVDAGHLSPVGLVRVAGVSPWAMTRNHQVLAFGYEETDTLIRLRVYDPNHPGRDDVELRAEVDPDGSLPWRDRVQLSQSTGEPLLGFFRQPYPAPGSLRAWR